MRPTVDAASGMTTCPSCGEDLQLSPNAVYETDPPVCRDCSLAEAGVIECDSCEGHCQEPTGDPDVASFCCLCIIDQERQWLPESKLTTPCELCRRREKAA